MESLFEDVKGMALQAIENIVDEEVRKAIHIHVHNYHQPPLYKNSEERRGHTWTEKEHKTLREEIKEAVGKIALNHQRTSLAITKMIEHKDLLNNIKW